MKYCLKFLVYLAFKNYTNVPPEASIWQQLLPIETAHIYLSMTTRKDDMIDDSQGVEEKHQGTAL